MYLPTKSVDSTTFLTASQLLRSGCDKPDGWRILGLLTPESLRQARNSRSSFDALLSPCCDPLSDTRRKRLFSKQAWLESEGRKT